MRLGDFDESHEVRAAAPHLGCRRQQFHFFECLLKFRAAGCDQATIRPPIRRKLCEAVARQLRRIGERSLTTEAQIRVKASDPMAAVAP